MYRLHQNNIYTNMQSTLSYIETKEVVLVKIACTNFEQWSKFEQWSSFTLNGHPLLMIFSFFFFFFFLSSETQRWKNNNKGVLYTSSGPYTDTETPTEQSSSQSKYNSLAK